MQVANLKVLEGMSASALSNIAIERIFDLDDVSIAGDVCKLSELTQILGYSHPISLNSYRLSMCLIEKVSGLFKKKSNGAYPCGE